MDLIFSLDNGGFLDYNNAGIKKSKTTAQKNFLNHSIAKILFSKMVTNLTVLDGFFGVKNQR